MKSYRENFLFFLSGVFASCLMCSGMVSAATVKGINSKKNLVQLDEGSASGLKKGVEVCVNDKKNKAITCGKVISVKTSTAVVRITDKEKFKQIKKGFSATYNIEGMDIAEEDSTVSGPMAGMHRRNIKFLHVLPILYPSKANKLSYAPITTGTSQSSLWTSAGGQDISLFGFGAEVEFPIGKSFSLAIGGRYVLIRGFASIDNYNKSTSNVFVETSQSFSNLGLWTDFYLFEAKLGSIFSTRFGSGIDLDMSSTKLTAEQKAENGGTATLGAFAGAEASMNTFSLRVPIDFMFFFKPIGVGFTPVLMLPLFGSSSAKADSTDTNATALGGKSAGDDLKEAIAYKKNGFAVILQSKIFWAF